MSGYRPETRAKLASDGGPGEARFLTGYLCLCSAARSQWSPGGQILYLAGPPTRRSRLDRPPVVVAATPYAVQYGLDHRVIGLRHDVVDPAMSLPVTILSASSTASADSLRKSATDEMTAGNCRDRPAETLPRTSCPVLTRAAVRTSARVSIRGIASAVVGIAAVRLALRRFPSRAASEAPVTPTLTSAEDPMEPARAFRAASNPNRGLVAQRRTQRLPWPKHQATTVHYPRDQSGRT